MCAGYIGEFEIVDDHRAGKIVVQLLGESQSRLFRLVCLPFASVSLGPWDARVLGSGRVEAERAGQCSPSESWALAAARRFPVMASPVAAPAPGGLCVKSYQAFGYGTNFASLFCSGRVNKCGIISPRFDMDASSSEKWVANLLPSRQFGYLVLTTSYGIMDHEEARRKQTGGKILGFFY